MFDSELLSSAWGILMVVLFFGGSIFVHELGHFLAAKWRGLHIERFSIGFGPKIVSWNRGGVEYRLSWLPLGGYVALPQLADMRGIEGESSIDEDAMPPISYTSKVIVAVAGAVFNIIFALIIATLLYFTGIPSSEAMASREVGYVAENVVDNEGNTVPGPAKEAGLQKGDIILSIDGAETANFEEIQEAIALGSGIDANGRRTATFKILRDGEQLELTTYPVLSPDDGIRRIGLGPGHDVYVGEVLPNSPADLAGIKAKDRLVSINGTSIRYAGEAIQLMSEKAHIPVEIVIGRLDKKGKEQLITTTATPVLKQTSKANAPRPIIGIGGLGSAPSTIVKNPIEQIQSVFQKAFKTISTLINPNSDISAKHMGGPVEIGRIIYIFSQNSILQTLWFVVVINVSLAVFNLMPIPVLDGGHIVFATINRLSKKGIQPNVIASLQGTFMILLFGLMLYVTYFNLARWKRDSDARSEAEANYIELTFTGNELAEQTAADTPEK